jgi:vitamin B12 transporter
LTISAGGTLLYNSQFGFLPGGGLDLSYNLGKSMRVFTGVNTSMRIPTFTELYYHDAVHSANPDLKPERTLGYQVGLRENIGRMNISVIPYYNRYFSKIDWVWDSLSCQYFSKNITDFDAYGLSATFNYDLNLLKGFIRKIYLSYTYLNYAHFSFYQSKYTANLTHQLARCYVDFSLWKRKQQSVSLTYNLVYKERFVSFFDKDFKNIILSDLKFSYLSSNLDLVVSVQNLFNSQYYDYYTPMPGRAYYLTMKLKF